MASLLGFVLDTGAAFTIMQKRYQYWSKDGLVWTDWFDWDTDFMPEYQMEDRRIFCRLKNEYRDESKVR
jgi:hypothetical protein